MNTETDIERDGRTTKEKEETGVRTVRVTRGRAPKPGTRIPGRSADSAERLAETLSDAAAEAFIERLFMLTLAFGKDDGRGDVTLPFREPLPWMDAEVHALKAGADGSPGLVVTARDGHGTETVAPEFPGADLAQLCRMTEDSLGLRGRDRFTAPLPGELGQGDETYAECLRADAVGAALFVPGTREFLEHAVRIGREAAALLGARDAADAPRPGATAVLGLPQPPKPFS